jgi:hypothetical protein
MFKNILRIATRGRPALLGFDELLTTSPSHVVICLDRVNTDKLFAAWKVYAPRRDVVHINGKNVLSGHTQTKKKILCFGSPWYYF